MDDGMSHAMAPVIGRVRVGLTLPSFVDDPAVPIAIARDAEAAGVDGVFVFDHLFRSSGDGGRRPALESIALLGAIAAATTRIHIGALVFRASLRPPASLASAVATLARLAPGRVISAIGAGDSESREENETFGVGFGTVADRVARLEAAARAVCDVGAPVWVGGHAARVRAVAAAAADGWNSWGSGIDWFRSSAAEARAAVRAPFVCSWGGLAVLDTDEARANAKAERLGARPGTLVGGPDTVAASLRDFAAAGAEWVIVGPVDSREPANAAHPRRAGEAPARLTWCTGQGGVGRLRCRGRVAEVLERSLTPDRDEQTLGFGRHRVAVEDAALRHDPPAIDVGVPSLEREHRVQRRRSSVANGQTRGHAGSTAADVHEAECLVERERDPTTVYVARRSFMGGTEHAVRVQASVAELVLKGRGDGVELPEQRTAGQVVALTLLADAADRAGRRRASPRTEATSCSAAVAAASSTVSSASAVSTVSLSARVAAARRKRAGVTNDSASG